MAIKYVIKKDSKYLACGENVQYTRNIESAMILHNRKTAQRLLWNDNEKVIKVDVQIKEIKNDK